MVDLATLTGACVVALGEHAAGLFTNDDVLRDELRKAGDDTFERLWPVSSHPPSSPFSLSYIYSSISLQLSSAFHSLYPVIFHPDENIKLTA